MLLSFLGPIASALVNKYGCRPVTMVGGVIGAGAFFAATFSPNLEALIVLYGILGGKLLFLLVRGRIRRGAREGIT